MPNHHAACAGRRVVFRVPCGTTKNVPLSDREGVMKDAVDVIEAAVKKVEEDEAWEAEQTGGAGGGLSFSKMMETVLDDHLPDTVRMLPPIEPGGGGGSVPGAPSPGPSQSALPPSPASS